MDNVQWVFGKHNFTFGGQSVAAQFNYYAALTASGPMDYTFSAAQTGMLYLWHHHQYVDRLLGRQLYAGRCQRQAAPWPTLPASARAI